MDVTLTLTFTRAARGFGRRCVAAADTEASRRTRKETSSTQVIRLLSSTASAIFLMVPVGNPMQMSIKQNVHN